MIQYEKYIKMGTNTYMFGTVVLEISYDKFTKKIDIIPFKHVVCVEIEH